VVAFALRIFLLLAIPPTSDVFYYDTWAAKLVLSGVDPYGHPLSGVPQALATPGGENVFAYLPFTALFCVPFYLVGDVRLAMVAADLIIGASLFLYFRKWSLAVSALFLLVPATFYLNDASFAAAFVALSLVLESRNRNVAASIFLGLALASSLFAWLSLPFFVLRYLRLGKPKQLGLAIASPALISAPFVLAGPSAFFNDVLFFHLSRTPTEVFSPGGPFGFSLNPSLSGFMMTFAGQTAPPVLRVAIGLLALAILLRRIPRDPETSALQSGYPVSESSNLLRSSLFLTVAVLVIPSVFFFAYLEFPIVMFLSWLAGR